MQKSMVMHLSIQKINSTTDLSSLSPAEKYDLYLGRYDFPLPNMKESAPIF
jgi:hypothetical protein